MPDQKQLLDNRHAILHGLALIERLSGFSGFAFNPGILIEAANYLCSLDKDFVFRVLEQYCHRANQEPTQRSDNALLVARVSYVPNDRRQPLPRLALGAPDLKEPQDPSLFPIFPLHLVEGIPFLLIGGYVLGGEAMPPMDYIAWCARHCALRPEPLGATDDPVAAINRFLATSAWRQLAPSDYHDRMLQAQALRLVSPVTHAQA